MLIVAIDVGIKNLALCCYDFATNQVIHWDNVSLVSGRYVPAQNVQYVRDFVQRHAHLFDRASIVLIERQMRCNMRIIEAVLQTLFFDRCKVIHARSVKAHYGLSMRNYRANKAKAVEWATQFVRANPAVFVPSVLETFVRGTKQDDLADALLLVMYYLDTYSNQLTN
jgi:hypothetical protein